MVPSWARDEIKHQESSHFTFSEQSANWEISYLWNCSALITEHKIGLWSSLQNESEVYTDDGAHALVHFIDWLGGVDEGGLKILPLCADS